MQSQPAACTSSELHVTRFTKELYLRSLIGYYKYLQLHYASQTYRLGEYPLSIQWSTNGSAGKSLSPKL